MYVLTSLWTTMQVALIVFSRYPCTIIKVYSEQSSSQVAFRKMAGSSKKFPKIRRKTS